MRHAAFSTILTIKEAKSIDRSLKMNPALSFPPGVGSQTQKPLTKSSTFKNGKPEKFH